MTAEIIEDNIIINESATDDLNSEIFYIELDSFLRKTQDIFIEEPNRNNILTDSEVQLLMNTYNHERIKNIEEQNNGLCDSQRIARIQAIEDVMLNNNKGLISKVLSTLNITSEEFEQDCRQEGALGLLSAIRDYDPSLGLAKFSCYAYEIIRCKILDTMLSQSNYGDISLHVSRNYYRFKSASRELFPEKALDELKDTEITQVIEYCNEKNIEVPRTVSTIQRSIKAFENKNTRLDDLYTKRIKHAPNHSDEKIIETNFDIDRVLGCLETLLWQRQITRNDIDVFSLHTYFYTFKEIGEIFGFTKARAEQKYKKVKDKLAQAFDDKSEI